MKMSEVLEKHLDNSLKRFRDRAVANLNSEREEILAIAHILEAMRRSGEISDGNTLPTDEQLTKTLQEIINLETHISNGYRFL